MKLSLLVLTVVVAAVLVPNLSEGRIVSKCELKNKLFNRIIAPKWLKEHLLEVVICELTRMSNLNTSTVNVMGERGTTTTTIVPMMEETNLSTPWVDEMEGEEKPEKSAEELSPEEPTEETPTEELSAEETPTEETPTEELSAEETPTEETPTEEPSAEEVPAEDAKTETTTTKPTKTKLKAGKNRPKRMVEIFDEDLVWTEYEFKMEETVNLLRSNCDEIDIMETESKTDDEESDSNAEGDEENQKPWSLGKYGIFQLSDGYFCNSGYRWSKNKCKKSCSAFADDDITDDIECFMKIGCWKKIFQDRTRQCSEVKNYFDECK